MTSCLPSQHAPQCMVWVEQEEKNGCYSPLRLATLSMYGASLDLNSLIIQDEMSIRL